MDHHRFVLDHTVVREVPIVPEVLLRQADDSMHLWSKTEHLVLSGDVPPPFWAFAWAGGQALARYILDHPEVVRGRAVVDFASGSGLVGIAAALAGAARVTCIDIDPLAATAIRCNAELNHVALSVETRDCIGELFPDADVVLAGDVFYESGLSERVLAWLLGVATTGKLVLLGDPNRPYAPGAGFIALVEIDVPVPLDLEGTDMRRATIWKAGP